MASHELRTPLTAVSGFMQIARRRMSRMAGANDIPHPWRDEAQKSDETLEMANRQAKKLARLIDELLDVSRLQQGRVEMRLAEIDLADVVREVAERMRLLSKGHEIEAQIEGAAPIVADRDRIEQVFENLVGNAIKYSPESGRIDVSLRVNGTNAVVSVRDEGIGVAPGRSRRSSASSTARPTRAPTTSAVLGSGSTSAARSCHGITESSGPSATPTLERPSM